MYSREELEAVASKAAAEGARLVLRDLGVPSDDAGLLAFKRDLQEARDFVTALRSARHTVWVTMVKWGTTLVLAAIIAGMGWGLHDKIK